MTATDHAEQADQSVLPEGFDFTDPFLNEKAMPHDEFKALRDSSPVHWVEQAAGTYDGMAEESGSGYYAVTRHADVAAISKNSKDWSTAENGAIIRFTEGMTREQVEMQRMILINQDPPEHTGTRSLISRGFTPRSIHALEDVMTERAGMIVRARQRALEHAVQLLGSPAEAASDTQSL